MASILPSIPEALAAYIKERGITQGKLAEVLGMAPTHMSEVMHSKRPLTRLALARAYQLGIPAEILLQEPKK